MSLVICCEPMRMSPTSIKAPSSKTAKVVSPLAAATACLSADEIHQGVVCIDIGGSATSFAVFEAVLKAMGIGLNFLHRLPYEMNAYGGLVHVRPMVTNLLITL